MCTINILGSIHSRFPLGMSKIVFDASGITVIIWAPLSMHLTSIIIKNQTQYRILEKKIIKIFIYLILTLLAHLRD